MGIYAKAVAAHSVLSSMIAVSRVALHVLLPEMMERALETTLENSETGISGVGGQTRAGAPWSALTRLQ